MMSGRPDEWATTKQACRDELVVYVFFSSVYMYIYMYIRRYNEETKFSVTPSFVLTHSSDSIKYCLMSV